jgi:hypothetical protein
VDFASRWVSKATARRIARSTRTPIARSSKCGPNGMGSFFTLGLGVDELLADT